MVKKLRRIVDTGGKPRGWRWFLGFFISPTYTNLSKTLFEQLQKWRLIHDPSSYGLDHFWSTNVDIDKGDFPVTYPSTGTTTHEIFCKAKQSIVRFCVIGNWNYTRYRNLMINPAVWWCTGTRLENTCHFDAYWPFGARSMPAIFQKLLDAIRVIIQSNIPVDWFLGMLDDFLWITYRKEEEFVRSYFSVGA